MASSKKITLAKVIKLFQRIYSLSAKSDGLNVVRHDALHAMTGFDISLADELRVAVSEKSLSYEQTLRAARNREKKLRAFLKKEMRRGWKDVNAKANSLETKRFYRVQVQTVPLGDGEIKELHDLALKMDKAIRRLTGKFYRELTSEEIPGMDFRGVDCVVQAQTIKAKYQRPENKKIEERTSSIFSSVAKSRRRKKDLMPPAAGATWNTAARKTAPASMAI